MTHDVASLQGSAPEAWEVAFFRKIPRCSIEHAACLSGQGSYTRHASKKEEGATMSNEVCLLVRGRNRQHCPMRYVSNREETISNEVSRREEGAT
eukprot:CAMPEP_0195026814 /NCGR_PEP_ID=MMETSP0326_2-20130528/51084_1 /TAXON_ID=2866 ORGANISM="Crypthecodinium cohnii, Strain Seligo" /NCGR_SAMPLE_ID=MMETSP0326_2 /ASSEMBLY_ACC=CAM_ASM_000348 /LENGTH=94 /DNA_ID=CAMNT_0040048817 /DNA_START=12 /DNA_END=292 /DNA_ORIENTATION=+